jgi:hypothetical protein
MERLRQIMEGLFMLLRFPVLFVGLVFCAMPARAEWALAGDDGFSKIYFEPASLRKNADGSIYLRALTDYDPASPQAADFRLSEKGLSEIEQVLFDCEKSAYRSEGGAWFESHMATGPMRSDYPAKLPWRKVPSFYSSLFAKACAAR